MNASRRLLSKLTQNDVMIIPPRSNMDTLYSALQGVYSLFASPNGRNTFVETIDKGIINPNVLGQIDFGLFMSLALHHDLNNDNGVLKKYEFDGEEFLMGSQMALEKFQESLYSIDKDIIMNIEKEIEMVRQDGDTDDNLSEEEMPGREIEKKTMELEQRKELIERLVEEQMEMKKSTQQEDEDSLAHQMKQMLSKQFLDAIETQFSASVVQCYVNDLLRMDYKLGSGEVLNAALMSARTHEVPPEEEENDENNKKDTKPEIMMDDSFSNDRGEEYPVVAQIEVLYTLSQTFTRKKIGSSITTTPQPQEEDNDENDETEENEDHEKEHTMETAWVGVFEGWLSNRKNQPLRWKLVDNRPAWEFPAMAMGKPLN